MKMGRVIIATLLRSLILKWVNEIVSLRKWAWKLLFCKKPHWKCFDQNGWKSFFLLGFSLGLNNSTLAFTQIDAKWTGRVLLVRRLYAYDKFLFVLLLGKYDEFPVPYSRNMYFQDYGFPVDLALLNIMSF